MSNMGGKVSVKLKQLKIPYGVAVWRQICYLWEEFKKYVGLRVGNG